MIRWHSSGQSCISPSMGVSSCCICSGSRRCVARERYRPACRWKGAIADKDTVCVQWQFQPLKSCAARSAKCRGESHPPMARSARISPITGANLKPWPEQGEATIICGASGQPVDDEIAVRRHGVEAGLWPPSAGLPRTAGTVAETQDRRLRRAAKFRDRRLPGRPSRRRDDAWRFSIRCCRESESRNGCRAGSRTGTPEIFLRVNSCGRRRRQPAEHLPRHPQRHAQFRH